MFTFPESKVDGHIRNIDEHHENTTELNFGILIEFIETTLVCLQLFSL